MHYSDFGLTNTKKLLIRAMRGKYAVPAFNFYNMETLKAILNAATQTNSPVILAVSESALKYMDDDILMGMIRGAKYKKNQVALHLDHGHSFESCKHAIDIGFSSVMFDGSALPLSENIKISKKIADYAHKHDVSAETELGVLAGIEDELTYADSHLYTDPDIVADFVKQTNTDSLAIAVGTSHGLYKRKSDNEKLRFDILQQIANNIPNTPLVLHGASSIPQKYINDINKYGGKLNNARGINAAQLKRAISMHITKINVDSDLRLAFTAGIREQFYKNRSITNPRQYLNFAMDKVTKQCVDEIKNIMGSANKA